MSKLVKKFQLPAGSIDRRAPSSTYQRYMSGEPQMTYWIGETSKEPEYVQMGRENTKARDEVYGKPQSRTNYVTATRKEQQQAARDGYIAKQKALAALGLYKNKIDGAWGRGSRTAEQQALAQGYSWNGKEYMIDPSRKRLLSRQQALKDLGIYNGKVNGVWNDVAEAALDKAHRMGYRLENDKLIRDESIVPEGTKLQVMDDATGKMICADGYCAKWSNGEQRSKGNKLISGSAWQNSKNSKVIVNGYDSIKNQKPTTFDRGAINKYNRLAQQNVIDNLNLADLRDYDTVNMYYDSSPSAETAYNTGKNGVTSTHTGHIRVLDGTPYVVEELGGRALMTPVSELLNGSRPQFGITGIYRPREQNIFDNLLSVFY